MAQFAVWAPHAARVDLHLAADEARSMLAQDDGWWSLTVPEAQPEARYGFALDGGPIRPDPRSAHQPEGPDGRSALVEPAEFAWTDQAWRGLPLPGAVLYELHIGTFSGPGTFDAAIKQLDHLVELGVDAIELLPVAQFPGSRGWGYDGVNLFAPHHAYGGPDGLNRLVDACHARNLGVVLDVVYNHLGPGGNYLAEFGPYFTDRRRTFWGEAVNVDGPHSHQVRRFVIDNALMWLRDYHIDGLRLDAVHAIVDESAVHLLEQLAEEVEVLATALGRPLFLIAESDLNDPTFVRSRDAGGYGMHAAWADEWHHALHAGLSGDRDGYYADFGSLETLAKALRQAWVHDGTWSAHRNRVHGRPPTGLRGHQFVVSTQNHDQIGNRAVGERSGALLSEGRLRIAAGLLLSSPFTPMLFQGEEWGATTPFQYFTDHGDPELGAAVSAGRRNEFAAFGWDPAQVPDPQDADTFTRSKLDWAELAKPPHADLLAWHRDLIALRRAVPELADPRLERTETEVDEGLGRLLVRRGSVLVVANLGATPWRLPIPREHLLLAASDPGIRHCDDAVELPADTLAILGPPAARPV